MQSIHPQHIWLPKSKKVRWLIDCDSFFAHCEIALDPSLRNKMVCIGWDIIIAATYDAKRHGIKIGTPVWEAKKLLPSDTVYLLPRLAEYRKISAKIMEYIRTQCLQTQVFSIDEAFVEITGYDKVFATTYQQWIENLQHQIKERFDIPVSIWLAPTKLLAKIFAGLRKPYGTFIAFDPQEIDDILLWLELGDIPFVWNQTQKRLEHRCQTAYDFKHLSYELVRQELGKSGLKLRLELNNINAMTLSHTKEKPKSIGKSRSFNPYFTSDKSVLRWHLIANIEKAFQKLMISGMKTSHIKINFRDRAFHRFGAHEILAHPTNDRLEIIKICRRLYESIFVHTISYRTSGVRLSDLSDGSWLQMWLFGNEDIKSKSLNEATHAIFKKYQKKLSK